MPRRLPINASYLIAFVMAAALAAWLLSGVLTEEPAAEAPRPGDAFAVQVERREAEPVTRYIVGQGDVQANRAVTVRAEVPGRVEEIGARRGTPVDEGELIVRLDVREREARLEQARAALDQAEQAYEAAERLEEQGFQTEARRREAFAALQAARSQLLQVELEIEDAAIEAPFAGVLNERFAELGQFVAVNDPVAEVIDIDPLLAVLQVSQRRIGEVEPGMPAEVALATGAVAEGVVSYISAEADPETRTFRVEVEVPNPDGALPAGVSAEIRLPVETVTAHFLSPALLSLGPGGALGIKTVDDRGRVAFHEIDVVRSEANGIWVAGLPEAARVITVGQGFVQAGERVVAVEAGEGAAAGGSAAAVPDNDRTQARLVPGGGLR